MINLKLKSGSYYSVAYWIYSHFNKQYWRGKSFFLIFFTIWFSFWKIQKKKRIILFIVLIMVYVINHSLVTWNVLYLNTSHDSSALNANLCINNNVKPRESNEPTNRQRERNKIAYETYFGNQISLHFVELEITKEMWSRTKIKSRQNGLREKKRTLIKITERGWRTAFKFDGAH